MLFTLFGIVNSVILFPENAALPIVFKLLFDSKFKFVKFLLSENAYQEGKKYSLF